MSELKEFIEYLNSRISDVIETCDAKMILEYTFGLLDEKIPDRLLYSFEDMTPIIKHFVDENDELMIWTVHDTLMSMFLIVNIYEFNLDEKQTAIYHQINKKLSNDLNNNNYLEIMKILK